MLAEHFPVAGASSVYFDADGVGGAAAVQFAAVTPGWPSPPASSP